MTDISKTDNSKHSYTVPCSSSFRDAVLLLAEKKRVNSGDLARSVILTLPSSLIESQKDPGEPVEGDREEIILKSGPSAGRPWKRKPRLQVRLPEGYGIPFIRRALFLAMQMDEGRLTVSLQDKAVLEALKKQEQQASVRNISKTEEYEEVKEKIERLKAAVSVLSFDPLPSGVMNAEDAKYVLGFPPHMPVDRRILKARFRMLATIHHPDNGEFGSHKRMSQLNAAMEILSLS